MWDIIERMANDRLWIYTGIAGALLGAAFLAWFRTTRLGIWAYNKFRNFLTNISIRWNLDLFQTPEDVWRMQYPDIAKKVDELEKRIANLEGKNEI